jgi:hypothetical protein
MCTHSALHLPGLSVVRALRTRLDSARIATGSEHVRAHRRLGAVGVRLVRVVEARCARLAGGELGRHRAQWTQSARCRLGQGVCVARARQTLVGRLIRSIGAGSTTRAA